jgi:hypothetical protein
VLADPSGKLAPPSHDHVWPKEIDCIGSLNGYAKPAKGTAGSPVVQLRYKFRLTKSMGTACTARVVVPDGYVRTGSVSIVEVA